MGSICLYKVTAALATLSFATAAYAQYIWLDEKGVRQYSDMPPGPSVPLSRILKEPVARAQPQAASAPAGNKNESSEAATGSAKPGMTTAEKNADFQKRRMEQAEKDKKAAEEAKHTADLAANCERARAYNRGLAAGGRMSTTDQSGARSYLTDEERAKNIQENKVILDGCPSSAASPPSGGEGNKGY
jgi:hypothetical protein